MINRAISRSSILSAAAIAALAGAKPASAVQFPFLDPTYSQQIYASTTSSAPQIGSLGAWANNGDLLTRAGANVLEYSPTANLTVNATSIHTVITTHTISGLSSSGAAITNGLNGFLYANTNAGLERIDPSNWAAPAVAVNSIGGNWGICAMPDGRIAYSGGAADASVYMYNPANNSTGLFYTSGSGATVDGIVSAPNGDLAVTNHNVPFQIQILNSSGGMVNSFATGTHAPDGLAFAMNASASILYSSNNDGTITQYAFPSANYAGAPTVNIIASGSQAYGDFALVGPDCSFYVSQFENGGLNGSTAGVGTNWDNSTTTADPSIVKITGGLMPDGTTVCAFYTPFTGSVPEPTVLSSLICGIPLLLLRRRKVTQ